MASPGFLSKCCIAANVSNSTELEGRKIGEVINILSIVFCSISLSSVLFLVWPRKEGNSEVFQSKNRILVGPNLNSIIKSLVAVNVLAVIGLLVRSAVWLDHAFPDTKKKCMDANHYFCLVSNMWILFFFTCNHFWHLVYAIEAYMVSNNKELNTGLKVFVGWFIPIFLTASAAVVVYYQGFNLCFSLTTPKSYIVYILFLCPVVIVMLANPIIFYQAGKSAKRALIWHYGRYTSSERKLVDAIHTKFYLILAVSNPLQAVLAALVFWGLPNTNQLRLNIFSQSEVGYGSSSGSSIINRSGLSAHSGLSTGSESEPLISYRQKTMF
uniref:G-protein coupled receptors family 2 profile 2 domain-containing protein n=1 Tax=Magallana gigas TaxID=29159 RepID=K1R8E3_MAGGI